MSFSKDFDESIGEVYVTKNKIVKNKIEDNDWIVTYADVVTLLMAFFVILLSMSTIDQTKVEQFMQGMNEELLKKENEPPFKELKQQLDVILVEKGLTNDVDVGLDPMGIVIKFSSNSIFELGSAEVLPDIQPVMAEISKSVLNSIQKASFTNYIINVEGHTDNIPIHNDKFAYDWELSAARATGVVRLFIENGIPNKRLIASGFSDSRPRVANFNPDGSANSKNQAINRRVVVNIHKY